MDVFLTCLFIGISLSMDAFSLALLYGTCGFSLSRQILISCIVGVFHFFMPLIGFWFGSFILKSFQIYSNILVGIIFGIIGVDMILSVRKEEKIDMIYGVVGYLLFGFTVSIDSLTTGIGLSVITSHYYMAVIIFMLCSGIFTFLGFLLGNRLNLCFGKYATLLGGIIMILLAIMYIL